MASDSRSGSLDARDFSQPVTFELDRCRPDKTIDIGSGGTSVSADPFGRILQLSTFHPKHGIVVATPFAQFDGARFREPTYVRAYRRQMLDMVAEGRPGYGLILSPGDGGDGGLASPSEVAIDFRDCSTARIQYQLRPGVAASCMLCVRPGGEAVQAVEIANAGAAPAAVTYELRLRVSVNRASYGQLTEGGPIPIPQSENALDINEDGRCFSVANTFLDAHLEGCLEVDGVPIELGQLQSQTLRDAPISASVPGSVEVAARSTVSLVARFRLSPGVELQGKFQPSQSPSSRAQQLVSCYWKDAHSAETYVIRRNIDYILGNLAIPVSDGEVALMTDHVALPLGWNRDNYWQVRFLIKADLNLDRLVDAHAVEGLRQAIRRVVRGHLSWVFRRAERAQGYWHRSYLVTGKAKDGPVFQLDQQCFPFLELCQYYDAYPGDADFIRGLFEEEVIETLLKLIVDIVDPGCGLVPADESPGDDEMEHPFSLSNHVLLWHTLARLRATIAKCGPSPAALERLEPLLETLLAKTVQPQHFFVEGDRPMLAYVTDGKGSHTFYHDGNDIPTVFAMEWGLPAAYEEAWKNTMEFAFSPENSKGYCPDGPYEGLGSVHSGGAWPLGYFQEFYYAGLRGDGARRRDAWHRIRGVMQWDGTFSEAVDPATGRCSSKAWFSWPGAMIGAALIDLRCGPST